MKLPTYWYYIVYFIIGVVMLVDGGHPAWMLVPLACACIGGARDNYYRK